MIFVTGPHGTGKTHFANFLLKEGFRFVDTGPALRSLWKKSNLGLKYKSFIKNGENLFGKDFTNWFLANEISRELQTLATENFNKDLLVVGNRSPEGIDYLRKNVIHANGKPSVVIYIEAEEEFLHARYCKRERVQISIEEFRTKKLLPDKLLGVERIRERADYILVNNNNIPDFESKIIELVYGDLGIERESGRVERN